MIETNYWKIRIHLDYIKNISNIKYKFFPSPRLSLSGGNLKFEDDVLEVEDVEVEIILNPLSIINYKILDYNKLLIISLLINS